MQDILNIDLKKILSTNSQKMNFIIIMLVLVLLLLVFNAYRINIDPPDYVCNVNQDTLQELVILKNLTLGLSDSQLNYLSNNLEKIINADLELILIDIFGENGEGTTVICENSCTDETETKYVCCNGEITDSFSECSDNSLECCGGDQPEEPDEEPCAESGYPCAYDSDCCDKLECENGYCIPCTCSETDSGNDPYNYGQTTGWWTPTGECTTKKDHCSGTLLEEYYCGADGYMKKANYECEYACEDGACSTTSPEEDCFGIGELCVSGNDCCSPYVCYFGECWDCGYEGYTCDTAYGDTCCEGYVCLSGSCYPNPQ